ncbi:MAG TPA: Ku protein [Casimicrobiaceae bacterium]|nr:Ku protein [Casimicrobiaceae bacterium]
MARVVWKGAIVFGLVHVPVDLYPGSKDQTLDFDWIDKRDMAPVGYRRINKVTGEPIEAENIVKGFEVEAGHYVVLEDEDFKAANPKATQTVEILAFVDAAAIPPQFFERPYRLVPGKRGEKGYVLLRETLKRSNKVGVAQVVIRNRQHLALLMPSGPMLALITMRWADEVLSHEEFALPDEGKHVAGVTDKELDLAQRLVDDMTEAWDPAKYKDTYRDDLMQRIDALATQGRTHVVKQTRRDEESGGGAQIIDLMAALKKSLGDKGDAGARGKAEPKARAPAKRAASTRARSAKSLKTATRKRA